MEMDGTEAASGLTESMKIRAQTVLIFRRKSFNVRSFYFSQSF